MGMSTHVVGFKPPDDKWKKMSAAYNSCLSAGISIPKEVMEFFNHMPPDDAGVEVDLEKHPCSVKYNPKNRESDGFEIDIRKLPPDVTIIRFYNSY